LPQLSETLAYGPAEPVAQPISLTGWRQPEQAIENATASRVLECISNHDAMRMLATAKTRPSTNTSA
jgi:hypothetical protein